MVMLCYSWGFSDFAGEKGVASGTAEGDFIGPCDCSDGTPQALIL
jgi:7-cyano-7-deazaguanine synthase in queuosine biosynthesis